MDTAANETTLFFHQLEEILDAGGPVKQEYEDIEKICDSLMKSNLTVSQENQLYQILKPILTLESVIGHSFLKPYGYTGDFKVIDMMYQNWRSTSSEEMYKWDDFFQNLHSVRAVRNRKDYFISELNQLLSKNNSAKILDLASGPCTDIYEFCMRYPHNNFEFDCLDMDSDAIEYGSGMCDNYIDSIRFINKNAFRFRPDKKYDLIWSAGLFDYFNDKLFKRLITRMYETLNEGGVLVVGNFSDYNPSRGVMEILGQWYMHHRSEQDLIQLALDIGIPLEKISLGHEETKVNLFLHLHK